MTQHKKTALVALSIAVAALAMGLWLRNFDVSPSDLDHLLAVLRWWPILPLFLLLTLHVALSSWRWILIEVALGGDKPKFSAALVTGAFALGLGTFLPSPVVNVACRGFANRVAGTSGLRGALSGGLDQVADLVVVLLMAIPAGIAIYCQNLGVFLLGAFAMALLGCGGVWILPPLFRSMNLPARFPRMGWMASLADRSLLLKLYSISLLRVANLTVMNLAIHAATGTASVTAVVIGVPLATLAMSIAMLPGAFGVSEWSFSAVFSSLGIARADIVIFVLANRILLTSLSLLLALFAALTMLAALRLTGGKVKTSD